MTRTHGMNIVVFMAQVDVIVRRDLPPLASRSCAPLRSVDYAMFMPAGLPEGSNLQDAPGCTARWRTACTAIAQRIILDGGARYKPRPQELKGLMLK